MTATDPHPHVSADAAGPSPLQDGFYVSGNFAPVRDEMTTFDLPVVGELPVELSGRFLRNGPNPLDDVDPATHHWFEGDGMVHGVRLREGRAEWYRNRYVGSARVARSRGDDDIAGPNWNGNPGGPNTNVGGFAGTTWALVEAGGCPVELTYELETIARNDFGGTLPGAFTAHPKVDPSTGEMHAIVYAWAEWLDHVQYVVVGTDGRVRRTLDIPLPGMTMVHDMSLTERFAVVYDQPCTVDLELALAGRFPLRWDPDYGNRLGLLPRGATDASEITWIDVPLGYVFHPLNAYDAPDGTLVLDLCRYERMFDRDLQGPLGDGLARLERWQVDPLRRSVSTTVVDERPNEFPRHRGALTGRPYRFGYCSALTTEPERGWATVKHDLVTGDRAAFDHGPGRAAGEAVFVGRAGSDPVADEDDGWLLMFVHDLGSSTAELAVLDARDLDRGYVARVPIPHRVPFGFHGNWVSDRAVTPPG